jgi:hypothetical protein
VGGPRESPRQPATGGAARTQDVRRERGRALGHEYQFDLDSPDGRLFLERLLAFLERRLG